MNLLWVILFCSNPFGTDSARFDATADFTLERNPAGPWSYRYADDTLRDGDYPLLKHTAPLDVTGGGATVWHADETPRAIRPFIGVKTEDFAGVGTWANGELAIHPGKSGRAIGPGLVVLTFTSEDDGSADIDFDLTLALNGDVSWFVELNDSSQTLASGAMAGDGDTESISLDSISLAAGDRISLVIDTNGSEGRDLVRVNKGVIEVTTENSTPFCWQLTFWKKLSRYRFCKWISLFKVKKLKRKK